MKTSPKGLSLTASLTFTAIDNAGNVIGREQIETFNLVWYCASGSYADTQELIYNNGVDVYKNYKEFVLEDPQLNEDHESRMEDGTKAIWNEANDLVEDLDDFLNKHKHWNIKWHYNPFQ